jgi:hypothetical protein
VSSEPSVDTIGQIFLSSYKLGDINVFHGVPFISQEGQKWIGLRHEDNSPVKLQVPLWQNQQTVLQSESLTHPGIPNLPDRSLVEAYLTKYRASQFANHMPLVDPVLFELAIDEAYSCQMSDYRRASLMKSYMYAFLTLGSLIDDQRETVIPDLDTKVYEAAQLLGPDLFGARASTEAVDTIMMLVSYFCPNTISEADVVSLGSFPIQLGQYPLG